MSCFTADLKKSDLSVLDPYKRVNYVLGMVLGVDDFRQEQAYHQEQVKRLARDLLGYGTVCGLAVIPERDGAKGWQVRVSAGEAISPSGQLICVPDSQCCNLNDWLNEQTKDKTKNVALTAARNESANLTLYVVLSYRARLMDDAPIPGEPCRSEGELMKPSRLRDCYGLELRYQPPAQLEEDAAREFKAWLKAIPIDDASPTFNTDAKFLEQLREAAKHWLTSFPDAPLPGSFVYEEKPVRISLEQYRTILRLWVTDIRPRQIAAYGTCAQLSLKQEDDAVLLAELKLNLVQITVSDAAQIPKSDVWIVSDEKGKVPTKNEKNRPLLVSLLMAEESLSCLRTKPWPEPQIIAAGYFRIQSTEGQSAKAEVIPAGSGEYPKLVASPPQEQKFPYFIPFSFPGFDNKQAYVVRLTPGISRKMEGEKWVESVKSEFNVRFAGFTEEGFLVRLQCVTRGITTIEKLGAVDLMIEVARYGVN